MNPLWTPKPAVLWSPTAMMLHRRSMSGRSVSITPDLSATHTKDNFNFGAQIALNAPATFVAATHAPASLGLASTYTVNKPAGVAGGDLLLIGLLVIDGSVVTAPSDLSLALLINTVTPTIGTGSSLIFYLYSKVATGSDPASWSFGLSSSWWTSLVAADYRGPSGIGAANWFAGSGSSGFDPGNNPIDAPSITTTPGVTVVALFGAGVFQQTDVITTPGSVTLRQATTNGYSTYSWTDFTA